MSSGSPSDTLAGVDMLRGTYVYAVPLFSRHIRRLTLHWGSDSNGDVRADLPIHIEGRLLMGQCIPSPSTATRPDANYNLQLMDEHRDIDDDLLNKVFVPTGASSNFTQIDELITDNNEDLEGFPVLVDRVQFRVDSAGANKYGRFILYWQEKGW